MDKINKYITENKIIYTEKLNMSVSYFDIRKVFLEYKKTNKYTVSTIKDNEYIELIKPFICSNVNSTYYHLVLIYKSNTSHAMILFYDIITDDSTCIIIEVKKVNFNFTKYNNDFYNIFVY